MKISNLGYSELTKCMNNRYPFLMLDGISQAETMKWAKGFKNFSLNEWYFQGHFQDDPNVPGAIQLEVMIETFIMSFLSDKAYRGMKTADSQITELKFLRKIKPGDKLDTCASLESFKHGVARGHVDGFVGEELVCSCKLVVCIPELLVVPTKR